MQILSGMRVDISRMVSEVHIGVAKAKKVKGPRRDPPREYIVSKIIEL